MALAAHPDPVSMVYGSRDCWHRDGPSQIHARPAKALPRGAVGAGQLPERAHRHVAACGILGAMAPRTWMQEMLAWMLKSIFCCHPSHQALRPFTCSHPPSNVLMVRAQEP